MMIAFFHQHGRALRLCGCAALSLLLSGCLSAPEETTAPTPTVQAAPAPAEATVAPPPKSVNSIEQCRKALDSLQKINPQSYRQKKAYFDSLLGSVAQYSAVRGEVSGGTKDTIDALYKFKTNKVCADIENEVMNGLVRRAERMTP
ncbi:hypothetical protein [Serratia rubidaea]|uniref:hypothetical protein n=1 Tax=Serratia rubidaea TaxID=61652 RepID=UPI001782000E|nr:hypothetical protein [Serratia rubidaea]MBD8453639.1 hypothetical protein [Serratia rubidaea]